MKSKIKKEFGKVVRALRNEMGISQEKLADMTGFHRTYIGMVERGERNISIENIEKFATVFNIKIWELFQYVDNNKYKN